MKKQKQVTKKQLERILKLNKKIYRMLPEGDAMKETYLRMNKFLLDRIETYDQFLVNPYKMHTSQPKFNSDSELNLGDYKEKI